MMFSVRIHFTGEETHDINRNGSHNQPDRRVGLLLFYKKCPEAQSGKTFRLSPDSGPLYIAYTVGVIHR